MSKDRAAPFSRKHRRYWLPVTGGMILIGGVNVALGVLSYDAPPTRTEKIELVLPPPTGTGDAGIGVSDASVIDASGLDAAP